MFPEAERQIFEYTLPCGEKRFADPLRVRRRLGQACAGKLNELLKACALPDEVERSPAEERLAVATATAFEMPTFDNKTGRGMTEQYLLDLLEAFLKWLNAKKKSGEIHSSSPVPSGSSPGPSATKATSDFCSTPARSG